MSQDDILLELRFPRAAKASLEISTASLKSVDVEVAETARDPTILAALTIAGAAVKLITELVKLAKELRSMGEKHNIQVVKLDDENRERTINLLETSDDELGSFIRGE